MDIAWTLKKHMLGIVQFHGEPFLFETTDNCFFFHDYFEKPVSCFQGKTYKHINSDLIEQSKVHGFGDLDAKTRSIGFVSAKTFRLRYFELILEEEKSESVAERSRSSWMLFVRKRIHSAVSNYISTCPFQWS